MTPPYPLLSSSLVLTRYVRVEAVFSSVQQERQTERLVSQILTFVLTATFDRHNVCRQPSVTRNSENKDTLCKQLGAQGAIQSPYDIHSYLYSWLLTTDSKWNMLLQVYFYWRECPIEVDEKLFPLCRRYGLRILLDESIKTICSVLSYSNPTDLINPAMWIRSRKIWALRDWQKEHRGIRYAAFSCDLFFLDLSCRNSSL